MKRSLFAFLATTFALAACGGGGGGTPSSASGAASQQDGVVPQVTSATSSSSIQASGTVTRTFINGFALQSGSPHGLIDVYTSSTTTFSGAKPMANEQVSVTGTGSWSSSIAATSVSQVLSSGSGVAAPTPAPLAMPSLISTQGPIVSVSSTRFQINSGYPHGYVNVLYSASTTFIGATAPVVGKYVQVSGTGSFSTAVTGVAVTSWSAAPGSVTASGTITAGTAYGFTLSVSGSAVPIVINTSAVVAGGVPEVGAQATVTGPGSTSESITPVQVVVVDPTPAPTPGSTPTPTPGPISQIHVLTADYLSSPSGSGTVTPAQAAPYVTWASTYVQNAASMDAAGIKSMMYIDPNREAPGDYLYTSDETTFAHDCSGNRVTDTYTNGSTQVLQYVVDPSSPSMQALFHNEAVLRIGSAPVNAIFADDAGALTDFGFTTFPCNYTDNGWLQSEETYFTYSPVPVLFNGLNVLNGHNPSKSVALAAGNNVMGGNFEHCLVDDGIEKQNGWLWQAIENTQLEMTAANKVFSCESLRHVSAATAQDDRTYAYASFLLTYNPQLSMLWEMFNTTSGLHALPETQLVPINPVVPAPADVSSLQLTGGAYGREFRNCYIAGKFVSACAVVVNPNSSATAPFPYPQYTHTLVLNGSDALDGGSIATNGPPPPLYLPALGSAIVFP